MSNVTRRDFIKGLAAGAVSIGAFGLAGAADKVAFAKEAAGSGGALYIPGTYTSVQSTSFAKAEITCTFSENALTDVSYTVLESSADDFFSRMEADVLEYCRRIVEAGTTDDVDGISGASLCTDAIRNGVNACRAQALGVTIPAAAETAQSGARVINPQDTDFHSNSSPDLSQTVLFSDWQLGPKTFNHRMVKSAAFQLAFLRRNPDEYINYYKRMADGGVQSARARAGLHVDLQRGDDLFNQVGDVVGLAHRHDIGVGRVFAAEQVAHIALAAARLSDDQVRAAHLLGHLQTHQNAFHLRCHHRLPILLLQGETHIVGQLLPVFVGNLHRLAGGGIGHRVRLAVEHVAHVLRTDSCVPCQVVLTQSVFGRILLRSLHNLLFLF